MYNELLAELRMHHCDAKEDDTQEVCEECAYDVIIADKSVPSGIASVCVCGLMHRAADAIEELQAVVDGLTAQTNMVFEKTEGRTVIKFEPKWIPVTERLPKHAYGEGDSVLTVSSLGSMRVLYFDGGNWCYPTGEALTTARKYPITHWMALPEPPKGG